MELRSTWSAVLIEALATWPIPRIGLVHSQGVHLRVLRALVAVGESILFDVAWVRVRTLLCQVELTVHVEVIDLLEGHASALLRFLLRLRGIRWLAIVVVGSSVIIRASLAVCTLFLNDELLARVGVDLVDLGQLLLLLDLQLLSLLLLVLLESFLALVARELAVIGALGHALGLGPARCIASATISGALRGYGARSCTALRRPLALRDSWGVPKVSWLYLPVDRVFVLARGIATNSNLTAVVLVM